MLAIDTNLVVRYLTADHPTQSARARTIIVDNEVSLAPPSCLKRNGFCVGSMDFLPRNSMTRYVAWGACRQ